MIASLVAVLVAGVLLSAVFRHYDVSAPLALVLAGLVADVIPGFPDIKLDPHLVLFVILPPLLWSAGLESSYVALRQNVRTIGLLAVGLPLATTFAVGVVAYKTVPELTVAGALTLGAIVAPPDAVSATAVCRRLGLPRRIVTLLGGESLLNDATALTVYRVVLAAAIGTAQGWGHPLATFALAAAGGLVVGGALGALIVYTRARLKDPLVESAIGLVAPFFIYLVAEQIHGSGVLAVVVAVLIVGARSTRAGYATRLQDEAVWKALQLVLESFAFLLIGLQLRDVIGDTVGMPASVVVMSSVAVLGAVIGARILWLYSFAFLSRLPSVRHRVRRPEPTPAELFVVAWAGMRGVVSLAAAFAVPLTTMSGAPFPGRANLVFLTFVVVIGTLLLQGLTLPWLIRALGVRGEQARTDVTAEAQAQERAARAATNRLDELLAARRAGGPCDAHERVADVLRGWHGRQRHGAGEGSIRDEDVGDSAAAVFRRLRREMLDAERVAFIAERDSGRIDDDVLRSVLHGLDLEEATLDRG